MDLGNVVLKLIWQRKCLGTAKSIVETKSERGLAPSVLPVWPFSLTQQWDRSVRRRPPSQGTECRRTVASHVVLGESTVHLEEK